MLPIEVENLEAIDEKFHELYEQVEGKEAFTLKIEDNVNGLRKALQSERANGQEAAKRLKEIEDERKAAEQARLEAEEASLKQKGEYQELFNRTQSKLDEMQQAILERDQKAAKQAELSMAKQLATEHGNTPDQAKLLAREIEQYVTTVDGKQVYQLAGGITVDEKTIVEHLRTEYPNAIKGSGSDGGGANGSSNKRGAVSSNPWKKDTLNLTEQARIQRDDPALANRLKNEA